MANKYVVTSGAVFALVAPLITDGSEDKKVETVEDDRGRPEKAGRGYHGARRQHLAAAPAASWTPWTTPTGIAVPRWRREVTEAGRRFTT